MDRNTNLRDMDAPKVGSGKLAEDTTLQGLAEYPSAAEKASNVLEQYNTEKPNTSGAGGRAKH